MAAVGTRAYDAAVAGVRRRHTNAVSSCFYSVEQVRAGPRPAYGRACAYRSAAIQQTHRILTLVLATNFVLVFLPLPFLFSFLGIRTRFLRSWTPNPNYAMRLFVTLSLSFNSAASMLAARSASHCDCAETSALALGQFAVCSVEWSKSGWSGSPLVRDLEQLASERVAQEESRAALAAAIQGARAALAGRMPSPQRSVRSARRRTPRAVAGDGTVGTSSKTGGATPVVAFPTRTSHTLGAYRDVILARR